MIGDRSLDILYETSGTKWLRELVWATAAELGHTRYFTRNANWIADDHHPFLAIGAPAIDLIDFNYGPQNRYWHTEADSLDKLSAESFQVVGDVIAAALKKLQEK
jgi:Zn-dependent M28 family amino/carboxypeptidase